MTFDATDPETWDDPKFHPDFGVDSAMQVEQLRVCCSALITEFSEVVTRLHVNSDDGVLYCEISTSDRQLGELYCVESLADCILGFGLFYESNDLTTEHEFYGDTVLDIFRIVAKILRGDG